MPDSPKVKTRIAAPVGAALLCLGAALAAGQEAPAVKKPPSLTEQVLRPLAKAVIIDEAFDGATAANTVLLIDLTHQMLTVSVAGQTAVTSPVTTGRRTLPTRPDSHAVASREENPKSSGYGYFVDKQGRVLVRGVYQSLDPPPSGAMFVDARLSHALLLGDGAPRIVGGYVRSTPSSNGDIIVPANVALALFKRVPDGAKVEVKR